MNEHNVEEGPETRIEHIEISNPLECYSTTTFHIHCTTPTSHMQLCSLSRAQAKFDEAIAENKVALGELRELSDGKKSSKPITKLVGAEDAAAKVDTTQVTATAIEGSTCATGTRVYEGSLLMAEFWFSNVGKSLLDKCRKRNGLIIKCQSDTGINVEDSEFFNDSNRFSTLELGCGCGIGGMAAAMTFNNLRGPASTVVLTDGNDLALSLCQRNISENKLSSNASEKPKTAKVETSLFNWSESGVSTFIDNQASAPPSFGQINIVIGCDIMYYKIDCVELLSAIKRLLQWRRNGCDSAHEADGIAILSHGMRLFNGRYLLSVAAEQLGMSLYTLDVMKSGIVPNLAERNWGGLEIVVISLVPLLTTSTEGHVGSSAAAGPALSSMIPFLSQYEAPRTRDGHVATVAEGDESEWLQGFGECE